MLHFPPDFPIDAVSVLVPLVRSGEVLQHRVEAGEAALTIVAYCAGQVIGAEPPASAKHALRAAVDMPDGLVLDALEHGLKQHAARKSGPTPAHGLGLGAFPVPPKTLALWAVRILTLILAG